MTTTTADVPTRSFDESFNDKQSSDTNDCRNLSRANYMAFGINKDCGHSPITADTAVRKSKALLRDSDRINGHHVIIVEWKMFWCCRFFVDAHATRFTILRPDNGDLGQLCQCTFKFINPRIRVSSRLSPTATAKWPRSRGRLPLSIW
jgi:hypothetical protein